MWSRTTTWIIRLGSLSHVVRVLCSCSMRLVECVILDEDTRLFVINFNTLQAIDLRQIHPTRTNSWICQYARNVDPTEPCACPQFSLRSLSRKVLGGGCRTDQVNAEDLTRSWILGIKLSPPAIIPVPPIAINNKCIHAGGSFNRRRCSFTEPPQQSRKETATPVCSPAP
jgi:hypothetical protein